MILTLLAPPHIHTAAGWTASDWATLVAAALGALVAAAIAVTGYSVQQQASRRDRRHVAYAEALRAVADYVEAPYLVRRHDGTAETRRTITQHISDIQSRIAFHDAWLQLHAPQEVHQAFSTYVAAARREAGAQMTAAWRTSPTRRDSEVPVGSAYAHPATDAARAIVLAAMAR